MILGCRIWFSLAPAVQSLSGVQWRWGGRGGVDGIRWCQSAQAPSVLPAQPRPCDQLVMELLVRTPSAAGELLTTSVCLWARHSFPAVESYGPGSPARSLPSRMLQPHLIQLCWASWERFPFQRGPSLLESFPSGEEHPLEQELADDGLLAKSSLSADFKIKFYWTHPCPFVLYCLYSVKWLWQR